MAASLRIKLNYHLGKEALTTLANLQLIFTKPAEQKKTTNKPTQHASPKKLTHLPQPKPEKLMVASSSPQPFRDVAPPPRLALTATPTRVHTPLYMSPKAPLEPAQRNVLMRTNRQIPPSLRSPNFPTAPPVPEVALLCRSPHVASLNIQLQGLIDEQTTTHPTIKPTKTPPPPAATITRPTVEAEEDTPAKNTRRKKAAYNSNPANNTRIRKAFRQNTQEKMLATFHIGKHTTSARTLARCQYPKEFLAAVLNEDTCELMEYCHLIGKLKYRTTRRKSYGNKFGCLAYVMPGRVKGTGTILFVDKADIPANPWKDVTC